MRCESNAAVNLCRPVCAMCSVMLVCLYGVALWLLSGNSLRLLFFPL